jgi:carboxypeptidase C (cathepsin A)
LDRELKYAAKETYFTRAQNFSGATWDRTHRLGAASGGQGQQQQPMRDAYLAGDWADAIRKNPRLRVFSANGLFHLATPFFITEYDLSHMNLAPKLRENVEFGYYHSGHMIYLNQEAMKELVRDLGGFYSRATAPGANH